MHIASPCLSPRTLALTALLATPLSIFRPLPRPRRPPPLLRHSQPPTTPDRRRYTKRDSRGAERKPSLWLVEVLRVPSYPNSKAAYFTSQDSIYKFNPKHVQQVSFEFISMQLPALSFRFLYHPDAAGTAPDGPHRSSGLSASPHRQRSRLLHPSMFICRMTSSSLD